jgi:hypothetical protein
MNPNYTAAAELGRNGTSPPLAASSARGGCAIAIGACRS